MTTCCKSVPSIHIVSPTGNVSSPVNIEIAYSFGCTPVKHGQGCFGKYYYSVQSLVGSGGTVYFSHYYDYTVTCGGNQNFNLNNQFSLPSGPYSLHAYTSALDGGNSSFASFNFNVT